MIKAVTNTKNYFQAPLNYFWQWTDNGDFIEWKNGTTICHRDELVLILKEAAIPNSAPLGAILLILSASMDSYNENEAAGILLGSLTALPVVNGDPDNETIERYVREALDFLDLVAKLPENLRSRKHSFRLLQEVFSTQNFVMNGASLRDEADELNSGRIDHLIFQPGEKLVRTTCLMELDPLVKARNLFPTTSSLELRLRAGVYQLPEPIKIDLPEIVSGDLFDQLAAEPKTASLVRLAKHIIAALKIPIHSQGSGDQSYGGISDITNRGNYDKLLLSELANDDLLLMARLVNNEALYFRREEPPDNPKRQRTILLDSTLKMWGMPRVFALASALACAKNSKHGELIEAYVLGGSKYKEVGLDSKDEVIKTLETLDHALHCGIALESIINKVPVSEQNEYILITSDESIKDPSFQQSFSNIKNSLNYLLFVNRKGKLEFYSCVKGRTKLLITANFDLEKILFFSNEQKYKQQKINDDLPLFIQKDTAPLYYPIVRINTSYKKCYSVKDIGTIIVNETNRVLFRSDGHKGVKELLSYVEDGNYSFGFGSNDLAFLMVQKQPQEGLWVYSFDLKNGNMVRKKHLEGFYMDKVVFDNNCFHINRWDRNYYKFNCVTWNMFEGTETEFLNLLKREESPVTVSSSLFYKLSTDNILTKFSHIFIDNSNRICLGNYHITQTNKDVIKLAAISNKERSLHVAELYENDYRPLPNKRIRFRKFVWDDGSEVVLDTRGFLHLRSSDTSLPEFTIALVVNKSTACWSSDGFICGSGYFYEPAMGTVISAERFYNNYFKPFINRILSA